MFVLFNLLPLLAMASIACGASPESQGEERVESTPPSAVEEGSDAGPGESVQGEPELPGPTLPRAAPPNAARGVRSDQAPATLTR